MTQKRVPLSARRTEDRKGVDLLIGESSSREMGSGAAPSQPPPAAAAKRLEKVTLYIRPEQVMGLEEIQLQQRRLTGRKPDKSALVQEALDLLIQKYSKTA